MIGIRARVNDVADGFVGEFADRRHNQVGRARTTRVHQHDAIRTDLHSNIAARAGDHVEVRTNGNNLEWRVAAGLRHAHPGERGQRQ